MKTTTTRAATAGKAKQRPKAQAAPAPPPAPDPAAPPVAKLSALSAAARVLAETGAALTCPQLIAAMAAHGYWISPSGRTPAATLSAAIRREIQTRGTQARFQQTGRGLFARRSGART